MGLTLLLCALRVVLAGTFLVSAVAKAFDTEGARSAVVAFGVPERADRAAVVGLVGAELTVAGLLLAGSTALLGASAAFVLLLLLTASVGVSLARGRRPECHCFGAASAKPIGAQTVFRNGVLIGVAGVVGATAWQGRSPSLVAWASGRDGLVVAAVVLAACGVVASAALTAFCLQLLRQNGRVLLRLDEFEALADGAIGHATVDAAGTVAEMGLPIGAVAPEFSLDGLYGDRVTLASLLARGKPVALVFSDVGCGPCAASMPDVARRQVEHRDRMTIAVVMTGDRDLIAAKAKQLDLSDVLLADSIEVASSYRFRGTPGAVLVDAEGRIASSVAAGTHEVSVLLDQGSVAMFSNGETARVAASPTPRAGAVVGDLVPDIVVTDASQRPRTLREFVAAPSVVLFWNQGCGFCQRLEPDLRAWALSKRANDPELVIVARALHDAPDLGGEWATLLVDESGALMAHFGANGTPMAVAVDATGRVASELVVGASSVLTILGVDEPRAQFA